MRITTANLAEWYATRNRLGGSDVLTRKESAVFMLAHNHEHGPFSGGRLTVAQVRRFVEWAAVHGSPVEREAVKA